MNNTIRFIFLLAMAIYPIIYTGCGDVEPPAPENEEEIINRVTLTFTEVEGGESLTFTAFDPDGEGPEPIEIEEIKLGTDLTYSLELKLENTFTADDITSEIASEAEEHLFYFEWTNDLFDSPVGNGNIDSRNDPVNYSDEDLNGLPLGLKTEWETGNARNGTFRVLLKHQPDIKSVNSTAEDGASDSDITFDVAIG